MTTIQKIKLHNFKRFQTFEADFNAQRNLLIGDNESGKSTILAAMDLVMSGSMSKVQTLGLESLFNKLTISKFLDGNKDINDLPEMYIELYLSDPRQQGLEGKNNTLENNQNGLRLKCTPRDDQTEAIKEILKQDEPNFPFEYYSIRFSTFADHSYSGYRKYFKHLLLDNSMINNEYATKEYIKSVYRS